MEYFLLAIFGLVTGSFLNVCIYRLPREKSIVFPSSACPSCGHSLGVFDLVPVLSFLFLSGSCRYCGEKITWRYPLVEMLTAGLFVFSGIFFHTPLAIATSIFFLCSLLVIFFTDLEHFIVPDQIVLPGVLIGLIIALLNNDLANAAWGAVLGAGFFWLIAKIGERIYKKEVMGYGDIKLSAMLGAFFGWQDLVIALYLSFIIGSVAGVLLIVTRRKKKDDYIPFAPSLILGAVAVFFWGSQIANWWLRIIGTAH
ncbi:MAG: prepilin peptidase [Candidatus Margulisiibacteriota bacterium]|jgi:leader peptidase (prepilin peptidase)/N-methyltransferase